MDNTLQIKKNFLSGKTTKKGFDQLRKLLLF